MIVADSSIAAATAVLLFLFATGRIEVWHIYAISLFRSLGGAFHYPAMSSSTTLMVPDKHLARVAGANQLLQGLVTIFAPPLGALLISVLPTQTVLAIDIATAGLAVLPLLFLSIPQPPRQVAQANGTVAKTSYWQDLRAGLLYVVRWPGLFGLILLAMALNFLLSPSSSLLPLLVTKGFGGGAQELAWVESAFGVGVILGGITLSAWGGFKRRIITSFAGVIGIGLGVILTGAVPAGFFYLVLAANLVLGFSQVFANGPLHAIFQSSIAPDMQGRVFSLISAGATAMMPLSLLVAGPVADTLGVRFWYITGGSICILMTLAALFIPSIINIEQNKQNPSPEMVE
jgi:DHA3 family macrolide efflux protein-like MFS transporter